MESTVITNDELASEKPARQTVDPAVSRAKFDAEVALFRSAESFQRTRGVLLLQAEFPSLVLAFATPRLYPRALAFAVRFDFTNYDLEPLSVQFVDPLTGEALSLDKLQACTMLNRRVAGPTQFAQHPNGQQVEVINQESLIQYHPPRNVPFLCLPGVREYHQHTAHTGDPWLLHRGQGEGTVGFLIDQICRYGTEMINSYLQPFSIAMGMQRDLSFNFGNVVLSSEPAPL